MGAGAIASGGPAEKQRFRVRVQADVNTGEKMKRISAVLVLMLAAFTVLATSATAQVPPTMNYQVMLTNDSDEPLADQAVTLVFHIYSQEVGGSPVWTETHNVTTNSIGVASVVLGTSNPIGMPFGTAYWLEVVVDSETMSPRRELTAAAYAHNARRLDGVDAADYALDDDLSATGVVNSPSNPVDWSMLKNVPAGFADGTDAEGGAGDGHSLDASDGSPTDALFVNAAGDVGIGTVSPQNRLTVNGFSNYCYAQLVNSATGYAMGDGFQVGINNLGDASINQQENRDLSFRTSGAYRGKFTSGGTFQLGSDLADGNLELYRNGSVGRVLAAEAGPYGGNLECYEDTGERYAYIEADINGTGGFLKILDGNGIGGLTVDGSTSGGNAVVSMSGSGSTTYFDTSHTGNAAVGLPGNSVSDAEILDEAGCASHSLTSGFSMSGPIESMLGRSITSPAAGYVLAIGTAEVAANHTTGSTSGCTFAVSESPGSYVGGHQIYCRIPAGAATGTYHQCVTVQWLFEVSTPSSDAFYFVADEVAGDWSVTDRNLTLIYIPSAYGGVTSSVASAPSDPEVAMPRLGRPLTEADIAAEQAESRAANDARIEQELAELEARIGQIRASMGNRSEQ